MAAYTLEEAQQHLREWLAAETAVASGQSYKIGGRELSRANLMRIAERVNFWRSEVARLERQAAGRGQRTAFRIVPRDL